MNSRIYEVFIQVFLFGPPGAEFRDPFPCDEVIAVSGRPADVSSETSQVTLNPPAVILTTRDLLEFSKR